MEKVYKSPGILICLFQMFLKVRKNNGNFDNLIEPFDNVKFEH